MPIARVSKNASPNGSQEGVFFGCFFWVFFLPISKIGVSSGVFLTKFENWCFFFGVFFLRSQKLMFLH